MSASAPKYQEPQNPIGRVRRRADDLNARTRRLALEGRPEYVVVRQDISGHCQSTP